MTRSTSHSRGHIVCLLREPFVDKIPNLRSMIQYFSEQGHRVDIVMPTDEAYPPPSFLDDMIHHTAPAGWKSLPFRTPTTLRLACSALKVCAKSRPICIIGAGLFGMMAAYLVSRILRIPLVCFCVELPAQKGQPPNQRQEKIERFVIRHAALVITHDEDHARFVHDQTGVASERICMLPNGTRGVAKNTGSTFLCDRFRLRPESLILLHSGGLGPWFESEELARSAGTWPDAWRLIFHSSHNVRSDPYAMRVMQSANEHVIFSTEPVATNALDDLVSSAHIGIALYSRKVLGYRADLMGRAAGKIGNYLKCGVPVVATDVVSIRNYLDRFRCGVCVRSANDIVRAVEQIRSNYDDYQKNALRCFDALWSPDAYSQEILRRIHTICDGNKVADSAVNQTLGG